MKRRIKVIGHWLLVIGFSVLQSFNPSGFLHAQSTLADACAHGTLRTNPDELVEANPNDTTVNWAEGFNIVDDPTEVFNNEKDMISKYFIKRAWKIVREKKQTVLHCYFVVPYDATKEIWLGGDEAYIVDPKTGTRYKARGTDDPRMWGKTFGIKAPAHSVVEFRVYFPPLPKDVNVIEIYGVQKWEFRGVRKIWIGKAGRANLYDKKVPEFHIPQLVEAEKPNYNPDDMDTYAVYNNIHLVQPMKEKTMAIWLTPEATYLAITAVQDWTREYFSFQKSIVLISESIPSKSFKLRRVLGLPTDRQFFIEGIVGDHQAFIMEFEPLPLDVTSITYYEPEGEPFKAWHANWDETLIPNLNISELRANQKLFKYYKRKIKK